MKLLKLLPLFLLPACASIVDGKSQTLSINTTPESGARCDLMNEAGKWYVETPGSVTIQRDIGELKISCLKGVLNGKAEVVSTTKSMAFGNILLGGGIGAIIDRENGSAFEYPQSITVPISEKGQLTRIEPPKPAQTEQKTQYPQ